jgi:biopolymer transport protein ExbB
VALTLERWMALRTTRMAPPGLADDVLAFTRDGLPTFEQLQRLAEASVLGAVIADALKLAVKEGSLSQEGLRAAVESRARVALSDGERHLTALGTIATAAPLLGLLGTVVGMIEIFSAQGAQGGMGLGNPTQLAQGISIALYNTAFGLIVAIPALVAHRHFRARLERHALMFDESLERLMPRLGQIQQRERRA